MNVCVCVCVSVCVCVLYEELQHEEGRETEFLWGKLNANHI